MRQPDDIDRQNVIALAVAALAIIAGVGLICMSVLH